MVKDFADLQTEISKADVLVVATGAATPTVHEEFINPNKPILILDLSIPKNVAEEVAQLPNVTLLHMDELSKRKDEALERRKESIPQALEIIEEVKGEFFQWVDNRKFAPTIKAIVLFSFLIESNKPIITLLFVVENRIIQLLDDQKEKERICLIPSIFV